MVQTNRRLVVESFFLFFFSPYSSLKGEFAKVITLKSEMKSTNNTLFITLFYTLLFNYLTCQFHYPIFCLNIIHYVNGNYMSNNESKEWRRECG